MGFSEVLLKDSDTKNEQFFFIIILSFFLLLFCNYFLYSQEPVNSTITIQASCSVLEPPDATISTFTITVQFNFPPNPVIVSPQGGQDTTIGYTLNKRPPIMFYANDKNEHQLGDWAVIVADDSNFTVNVSTYKFSISSSGWYLRPSAACPPQSISSPVSNGTTFYYIPQVDWSQNYHWIKIGVKDWGALGGDGSDRTAWGYSDKIKIYINPFSWTDTINAGQTIIRKIHFTELRAVIENLRQFRGLSTPIWTDPVLTEGVTPIRKIHIDELRQNLDEALYTICESTGSALWTDYNISAGNSLIRAVHINELRTNAAKP